MKSKAIGCFSWLLYCWLKMCFLVSGKKLEKSLFLGVELHVEASPMIHEMSPTWKRISSHRIFCSIYFLVRGCKTKQAANRPWPSSEPSDKNAIVKMGEVGQLIARLKADCGWKREGRRKFVLRNCQGGYRMIDQVSIIMSQRLRKGMWKDKVVNLFLTVYVFFLFPLLGQRKGGIQVEEGRLWPNPVRFCLCLILFLSCFLGWKKIKKYILVSPFLKIGEDTRLIWSSCHGEAVQLRNNY